MNKSTSNKIRISRAAASLYIENPRFTMKSLAKASDTEPHTLYNYFANRRDALHFFYEGLILEYYEAVKSIESYSSYTLSEKLSNFALTLIDQMEPHKEFVRQTYSDFVQCTSMDSGFNSLFKMELKAIYETDKKQSRLSAALNHSLLYRTGLINFHILIRFWLKDTSTGSQKTMELVDKWTALVQEVHYSSILDRGFDVAKFFYNNPPFSSFRN